MNDQFDVIIIGSGVIGSALARELTRYKLKIGVLEKEHDVCNETSGRNSGVIHGGFNYKTGTLKAECCVEGCLDFDRTAEELAIPFKRCGKVLVGFSEEDQESLRKSKELGERNGSKGLELIDEKRLKELAPHVNGKYALLSPYSGIVNPFIYTIALAENACSNGAEFYFGNEVTSINRKDGIFEISSVRDTYKTRWVVNCAGLNSAVISEMMGIPGYQIRGFKGEYYVLDQKAGEFLSLPAYPVSNPKIGMGIHATPTVDGNVIIGPNSEVVDDLGDYSVSQGTLNDLVEDGSRLFPSIKPEYFIRNFAGVRPKLVDPETGEVQDFVIEARDNVPGTINLVGIESPGLTSALPIARRAVKLLADRENLQKNENFNPCREGIVTFSDKTPEEKSRLIAENPDYGEVVCRCEEITRAEILQAIHNPLGVDTVIGIKNRTRASMGRCQGGYCQTRIIAIIQEEKNKDITEISYGREGSFMFTGKVRG